MKNVMIIFLLCSSCGAYAMEDKKSEIKKSAAVPIVANDFLRLPHQGQPNRSSSTSSSPSKQETRFSWKNSANWPDHHLEK